jgi:hypothetical protein
VDIMSGAGSALWRRRAGRRRRVRARGDELHLHRCTLLTYESNVNL